MIEKGLIRIGRPFNDINSAIENVGKLEVAKMEKNIAGLATIAGAAPNARIPRNCYRDDRCIL